MWPRVLLIAVGALSVISTATVLVRTERYRRIHGERWTADRLLIASVLLPPFLVFGVVCVIVGIWPGGQRLMYVAAAFLAGGYFARRWVARRIERRALDM